MPPFQPGFPWRLAIAFLTISFLLAALYLVKGPPHGGWGRGALTPSQGALSVAEVHGQPVSLLELEEALREHLWRHNQTWTTLSTEARQQLRSQVLDSLVTDRLIRTFRLIDGTHPLPPKAAIKQESALQQRQFAHPEEFPARLAAQRLTPKSLESGIAEAQLDEAWIAQKIRPQLSQITQQQVRAWYDQHKETLRIPQAHHAAHIFLTRHDSAKPDRTAEIQEIHRQLLARDKTFAQLALAHSDDDRTKGVGGDLGWFTRRHMPADFLAAVERLQIGQFSEPVLAKLGWHIIIVLERHDSRLPTFDEARDEITALLTSSQRETAVQTLISDLRQRSQLPAQSVFYHSEIIDRAGPAP